MVNFYHDQKYIFLLKININFMNNTNSLNSLAEKLRNIISEEDIKNIYANIKLKSEKQDDDIYIHGNTEWILYLTIFLLELAKNPNRDHIHFDEFNGMEPNSIWLILEKINI